MNFYLIITTKTIFTHLAAHITHNGTAKEVVLVDENVILKKMRPFLFLIWALKTVVLFIL